MYRSSAGEANALPGLRSAASPKSTEFLAWWAAAARRARYPWIPRRSISLQHSAPGLPLLAETQGAPLRRQRLHIRDHHIMRGPLMVLVACARPKGGCKVPTLVERQSKKGRRVHLSSGILRISSEDLLIGGKLDSVRISFLKFLRSSRTRSRPFFVIAPQLRAVLLPRVVM